VFYSISGPQFSSGTRKRKRRKKKKRKKGKDGERYEVQKSVCLIAVVNE
jgi:hypothetical protein